MRVKKDFDQGCRHSLVRQVLMRKERRRSKAENRKWMVHYMGNGYDVDDDDDEKRRKETWSTMMTMMTLRSS